MVDFGKVFLAPGESAPIICNLTALALAEPVVVQRQSTNTEKDDSGAMDEAQLAVLLGRWHVMLGDARWAMDVVAGPAGKPLLKNDDGNAGRATTLKSDDAGCFYEEGLMPGDILQSQQTRTTQRAAGRTTSVSATSRRMPQLFSTVSSTGQTGDEHQRVLCLRPPHLLLVFRGRGLQRRTGHEANNVVPGHRGVLCALLDTTVHPLCHSARG